MRKHKVRIIGVVSILLLMLSVVAIPKIYATETQETERDLSCKELADEFGLYIKSTATSGEYLLIKDVPTCSTPNEKHDSVEYEIESVNGGKSDAVGSKISKKNKEVKIKAALINKAGTNDYYLTVKLKNTDPEAEKLDYQYIEVKFSETREPAGSSSVKTVANKFYNTHCKDYRTEAGALTSEKGEFFKKAIPDCWKTNVTSNPDEDTLKANIKNTKELWEIYSNRTPEPADFATVAKKAKDAGNTIADPTKETICLNCNYKFVNTGNKEIKTYTNKYGDSIQSAEYYLNKDYYYTKSETTTDTLQYTYNYSVGQTVTKTHNACERTCEEAVKLEYGPPVASKAGLCFEYKVKVTSYVKCDAKFVAPEPTVPDGACTPAPRCESLSGTERNKPQAGPNEEFDSCVEKCDGGKYTEKCSLKCYEKAYGKTTNKKLAIDYSNVNVERLADSTSYSLKQCLEENKGYYGCYARGDSKIDWYALDNYTNSEGNIDVNNPTILYNNKNSLGRWYLDRAAKNNNYYNGGYDISGIKNTCTSGYCGSYVADGNGFYRANYSGSLCTDNCEWQTASCAEDKYLNPGTIAADKDRNREEYNKAMSACIASTKCETHQATFSISINYDKGNEKDNTTITRIDFPFTSDANSIGKGKAEDNEPKTMTGLKPGEASGSNDSIILDKDGCYKDKNAANKYMTEWSFPGTYIHNKTGEISFAEKSGDGWYYDDQKFCMPLDAESVNAKWWEWYKLGNNCYTDEQIQDELKGKTGTSNGYNIVARTRNFGKFKWNFDIKCFYALRNEVCNVKENGCCGTSKKENNGVMNYTFRTIDKGNMFPNALEAGVVDPTKREIGFNWTDKAKTNKNPSYEINPSALIEHIQSNSSSLYDSDKESDNLDYRFHLSPEDLALIKKDNKEHSYGKWTNGKINKNPVNGVYVYQSNLFRDTSGTRVLSGDSIIKLGELGENNQGSQPRGAE